MESLQEENTVSQEVLQAPNPEYVATLNCQLYSSTTRKDGGGRIALDFGLESLDALHKIQMWNGRGGVNFTVVIVPTDMMAQR